MQLIYEGVDITADIEIRRAYLIDNAGGEFDSIELCVNDPKGLWSQWKPEKNHTIQIKESGFDSGVMYADEISQRRGTISIKALPVKQEAKTEFTRAWDNVRFLEIAQEIAGRQGLRLTTYDIQNHFYNRVDQLQQSDLQFLSFRCLIEGYCLKVSNGKLIVFNESVMEAQAPSVTLIPDDIDGDFVFKNKSNQIYGACRVVNTLYPFEFKSGHGPTLKIDKLNPGSLGESERYSKALLRSKNKYEKTFSGLIRLDPGIAAGSTLQLKNFGLANGNYYAYQVIHRFKEKCTELRLRAPLEGY
ncbi:phage late control D family protein [Desulfitobacterium hafniense]|uniref:Phage protein D n=1 Tax=Desulfitobacterium hafniense (strain Y51) TaxID=138119 RepID=Q24VH8_DESHY|nr:phage late control D family protein [Desulfitobacterium hafniense]BAE83964.1 hypothetical protein DSY2175 [Desulfitobacterium hafniense Y51]